MRTFLLLALAATALGERFLVKEDFSKYGILVENDDPFDANDSIGENIFTPSPPP